MERQITKTIEEANKIAGENDLVYDIDKGISLVKVFSKKSINTTKSFYKLTKKLDKKDYKYKQKGFAKFYKENLKFIWEKEVESTFFKQNELKELTEEELINYILGLYIVAHSEKFKEQKDAIIAKTLAEILEVTNKRKYS
jgi:hypothetical protein